MHQINQTTQAKSSNIIIIQYLSLDKLIFQENLVMKERIFGPMNPIPLHEYENIYKNTKLDVDGRRSLYQDFCIGYVSACKRFAKFMRCLSGFNSLLISDQLTMIEGMSYPEFISHQTLSSITKRNTK